MRRGCVVVVVVVDMMMDYVLGTTDGELFAEFQFSLLEFSLESVPCMTAGHAQENRSRNELKFRNTRYRTVLTRLGTLGSILSRLNVARNR